MTDILNEKLKSYSWHDCPIYSIRFDDGLSLDIDYILEWKKDEIEFGFQYLIAPAILEFIDVSNLKVMIETEFINGLEINKIEYEDSYWRIELQEGLIEFKAVDFKQTLLKAAIWKTNQYLSEKERML